MCGIAGVLYRDRGRPVAAEVLASMGAAIAHRGPDAEGDWHNNGIGLYHKRLSIIDIEAGARLAGSRNYVLLGDLARYERAYTDFNG